MKTLPFFAVVLGAVLLGTGCAQYYNVTIGSGRTITSKGKPRYDKENGVFIFKDVHGEVRQVPAGSVTAIAPASDKSNTQGFNPKEAR